MSRLTDLVQRIRHRFRQRRFDLASLADTERQLRTAAAPPPPSPRREMLRAELLGGIERLAPRLGRPLAVLLVLSAITLGTATAVATSAPFIEQALPTPVRSFLTTIWELFEPDLDEITEPVEDEPPDVDRPTDEAPPLDAPTSAPPPQVVDEPPTPTPVAPTPAPTVPPVGDDDHNEPPVPVPTPATPPPLPTPDPPTPPPAP